MKRIELDALVRAHRGRAHPVAFFHVLRQPSLDEDDHAFLLEHAAELTAHDLLAWRARSTPGATGAVIRRLAQMAIDDPAHFEQEVLRAPRLDLAEDEWRELTDLTRGKVPDAVFALLVTRALRTLPSAPPPAAPEPPIDLGTLFRDTLDLPGAELPPPIQAEEAPELILERAKCAFSAEERAMLLGWLTRIGFARRPLIEIALGSVRAGASHRTLTTWLADQLVTRAAWEAHGVDVFLAFLDKDAFADLEDLLAQAWSQRAGAPDASRRMLEAIHAAFAVALLQIAREGAHHEGAASGSEPRRPGGALFGDSRRALAALSALACLDPPPRLSRAIHDLERMAGFEGELRVLVDLNTRLVKHAGGREASFAGVIAALQSLADARVED